MRCTVSTIRLASRWSCAFVRSVAAAGAAPPRRSHAQAPRVTTPMQEWGHNVGDDYFLANYQQLDRVLDEAREANRRAARRRDRQDVRGPADADGDHHVAGQLREDRSLQGDLDAGSRTPKG